ncbi:MAG: YabP/YqfC family sporulation protein [Clostridia bacterium]|nr:YabP/YqfC family sporulation protein [Clostridia bacterium]
MTIEQRKSISVSGVDSVKSFSESKIELSLLGGNTRLIVTGSGLKITGFSKTNGTFTATGTIESVRYGGSLRSKLFR